MKKSIALFVVLACSACGGSGGGGAETGGSGLNPTPPPDSRDVFEKIGDESSAQSGGKFSHEYFFLDSDVLGTASSITYACDDPLIVTEGELRNNGFGVTSNRVCLARGSATDCYYPGVNALRKEINSADGIENIVRLRGSRTDEVSSFDIGYEKPGRRNLDLIIQSAWTTDPACGDSSTATLVFSDIEGNWSVQSYSINSFGAPAIEESSTFVCSGTSCTGSAGISFTQITEDAESNSEGMYYSGVFTSAGAAYQNSRGIISKTKNMLSILACANGIDFNDQPETCRYVIAERR